MIERNLWAKPIGNDLFRQRRMPSISPRRAAALLLRIESAFQQIGCFRKSIGFGNHFLDAARIIAIDRVVEHMIKKKRKALDVQLL